MRDGAADLPFQPQVGFCVLELGNSDLPARCGKGLGIAGGIIESQGIAQLNFLKVGDRSKTWGIC